MTTVDFIAFGAHADDLEMGMGATLAKMAAQGQNGILVDFTKATAASRGTPEQRIDEAEAAAQVLGLPRINLGLPDAFLADHIDSAIQKAVELIRKHKPRVVFAPVADDYHPDHGAAHQIVKAAWYKAGLSVLWPELPKYRPERVFFYPGALMPKTSPAFYVDVDQYWEQRQKALLCYHSQFDRAGESNRPQTAVSSTRFQEEVVARHRYFGSQARCEFAEAFWSDLIPVIDNPLVIQGATYG